jgi:Flp pilus assembly protein TadB
LCCVCLWVVVSDSCCVVFVCEWWSTHKQTKHNMCQTPSLTNKHNTTCLRNHHSQTNTTQHVSDTFTHKQTQHNMSQTPSLRHMLCCVCLWVVLPDTCCVVFVSGGFWHVLCCVCLWVVVSDTCCVVFVCEWRCLTHVLCLFKQHNMCQTPPLTNKHNTTCVGHLHSQTNTTQHVSDTTTHKKTQDNMCQTPSFVSGGVWHMLCCVCLWVKVSDTCCLVFFCEWWCLTHQKPPLTNKHNTTCVRHLHSQTNTTQHVSDTTTHKQTTQHVSDSGGVWHMLCCLVCLWVVVSDTCCVVCLWVVVSDTCCVVLVCEWRCPPGLINWVNLPDVFQLSFSYN